MERLDDWQQVRRKKNHEKSYGKDYDVNRRAVTYCVQDFPSDWNEAALWKTFNMYGAVVDVYVARKLNRLNRRFGFVCFLMVRDIRAFETRLNEILIGAKKIRVNVAKFDIKGQDPRNINPHLKEGSKECMNSTLVGETENFQSLMNVKAFLKLEGCPKIQLRYRRHEYVTGFRKCRREK
ncbi:unnamed protein product [Lactuca saligna]|uniref:RRM domain-containing protein n=1 Tax=Lactuca saligna TaxID=75948 RepID=A0AA35ZUU7_LACSI|nr:unnamed protein product [Lactuca saligna]